MKRILVTGAGGFIGHHLCKYLKEIEECYVIGVDIKEPLFEDTAADFFILHDLRQPYLYGAELYDKLGKVDEIYHLAADMGGIGYITSKLADIAINNSLININIFKYAKEVGARILFSSSACVYCQSAQDRPNIRPLMECDAWPAMPEPGYGLEKLYAEELLSYLFNDHHLSVRIARFHNVYGPLGEYDGGREKAPAALCRKIARAKPGGTIEVWGDGKQTRSFMYIDDCVEGIHRLMASDFVLPMNLGRDEMISINELVHMISLIADKPVGIINDLTKPEGVRGRNSDNSLCRGVLDWEPPTTLMTGLKPTYEWIMRQVSG